MNRLVIATALVLFACQEESPSSVRNEKTENTLADEEAIAAAESVSLSDTERDQLQQAESNGDVNAARRLALDRFWARDIADAETLRLMRRWALRDPKGVPLLATLLVQSCLERDVLEGQALLIAFIASPEFSNLSRNDQSALRNASSRTDQRLAQSDDKRCVRFQD